MSDSQSNNPQRRNTSWRICIGSPLLRPGLSVESGEISIKYLAEEILSILNVVREVNK